MGNWTINYDSYVQNRLINQNAETHVVISKSTYKFLGWPRATPLSPKSDESGLSLVGTGSGIQFTQRDGTVYTFARVSNYSYDLLQSIKRPNGETETISYVSGRPKTIISNRGYAIVLDYYDGKVYSACGFNLAVSYVNTASTCDGAQLKTTYSYTGIDLTTYTDVMGNAGYYTNRLTCITPPGHAGCKISNTYLPGRPLIDYQTFADGSKWSYACSCGVDPDDVFHYGGYTGPEGLYVNATFVGENFQAQDYNVSGKNYLLRMYGRYPAGAQLPEGNIVWTNYNSRNVPGGKTLKAKPGSGLPDVTETWVYPTSCENPVTCNLPTQIIDARQNVTDFTYDPVHGGVLSEMRPPATAGASRPLKLNTYTQRNAYIKSSSGSLVAAEGSIWLPDTETSCQTVAGSNVAICDPSAPMTVVSFEYGADGTADNLLLRGKVVSADGVSLRTCFGYDFQGNKTWETSPRAGLASCQ